jgi:hypothetical protein
LAVLACEGNAIVAPTPESGGTSVTFAQCRTGCVKYPRIRKQLKRHNQIRIISLRSHAFYRRVNLITSLYYGLASQIAKPLAQPPVVPDDLNHTGQIIEGFVGIECHKLMPPGVQGIPNLNFQPMPNTSPEGLARSEVFGIG